MKLWRPGTGGSVSKLKQLFPVWRKNRYLKLCNIFWAFGSLPYQCIFGNGGILDEMPFSTAINKDSP